MCSAIVDERRSGILRRDMSVVEWNFAVTFCECLGRGPRAGKAGRTSTDQQEVKDPGTHDSGVGGCHL
jgi:hypothetical protein